MQMTPPGSAASVIFGKGITAGEPGSSRACSSPCPTSTRRARTSSPVASTSARRSTTPAASSTTPAPRRGSTGPAPDHADYGSFASFSDPDGNGWLLQEITTRLPGPRVDREATTTTYAEDLAEALRRAAAAHGEHEARTGEADANWPDWYAQYMVAERSGEELPT